MKRNHYFFVVFMLATFSSFNLAYYPSDPPTGRTGAPGEQTCQASGCHAGGAFSGTVSISGLPDTVAAGQTYAITLQHMSNAEVAGFQLTALDGDAKKAGNLTAGSGSNTATGTMSRQYIRQSFPINLSNGVGSWVFSWTAPNAAADNKIVFYFSSLAANGNGSNSGDNVLVSNKTVDLMPLVSANDPQEALWVICYPTLASDVLNIEAKEPLNFRLFDNGGRLVREQNLNGFHTVPVSDLQKGVYVAQFNAGGKLNSQRIVIR